MHYAMFKACATFLWLWYEMLTFHQSSFNCSFFFKMLKTCIAMQDAVKGQYWRLRDPQGKPPGAVGLWPSRAVTFIDNHDTGSTQVLNMLLDEFSMLHTWGETMENVFLFLHLRIYSIMYHFKMVFCPIIDWAEQVLLNLNCGWSYQLWFIIHYNLRLKLPCLSLSCLWWWNITIYRNEAWFQLSILINFFFILQAHWAFPSNHVMEVCKIVFCM